jgi:hypothetical protein
LPPLARLDARRSLAGRENPARTWFIGAALESLRLRKGNCGVVTPGRYPGGGADFGIQKRFFRDFQATVFEESASVPRSEPNPVGKRLPQMALSDIPEPKVPSLISILRMTLDRLEKNGGELDPSDPAVIELKNSILRAIGEIELKKMERVIV